MQVIQTRVKMTEDVMSATIVEKRLGLELKAPSTSVMSVSREPIYVNSARPGKVPATVEVMNVKYLIGVIASNEFASINGNI